MDVAGILLNYNTRQDVIRLATSLSALEGIVPLVVDNSSDVTLQTWCVDNNVQYEDTCSNLGYTGGNNVGLRAAMQEGFEYAFILNPDIEIKSLDIAGMIEILDRGNADILFPKVHDVDGGMQNDVPTTENRVLRFGGELPSLPESNDKRLRYVDHGPGSAMMLRLDMLDDIGYLREEFFMYGEEVELCYRARRAEYRVAIYRCSEVLHDHPKPEMWMSKFRMYYNVRNKFLRNKLLFGYSLIYSALILAYLAKYIQKIISKRTWELLQPMVLGIYDGLRLKTGRGRY
ncbi:glycosyltransferase [Halomicrobium mukohataei]|uniref:Glycosyltransferase n=1 Tax=Halomicrobium mukohataei TaxID=57705 RepID=A0A847U5U6_9EURY|nr:glycosyltransferase family 2 protein [Halomicrobium mukohataei]NLV08379.1 glycosyltransferase [Halomicrobium mukohataei]